MASPSQAQPSFTCHGDPHGPRALFLMPRACCTPQRTLHDCLTYACVGMRLRVHLRDVAVSNKSTRSHRPVQAPRLDLEWQCGCSPVLPPPPSPPLFYISIYTLASTLTCTSRIFFKDKKNKIYIHEWKPSSSTCWLDILISVFACLSVPVSRMTPVIKRWVQKD